LKERKFIPDIKEYYKQKLSPEKLKKVV
jgi:hypothetical protein